MLCQSTIELATTVMRSGVEVMRNVRRGGYIKASIDSRNYVGKEGDITIQVRTRPNHDEAK